MYWIPRASRGLLSVERAELALRHTVAPVPEAGEGNGVAANAGAFTNERRGLAMHIGGPCGRVIRRR
jgi:hypothetical protein